MLISSLLEAPADIPESSSSCFPTMTDCILRLQAKTNPSSLKLLLVGYLVTATGKVTQKMGSGSGAVGGINLICVVLRPTELFVEGMWKLGANREERP